MGAFDFDALLQKGRAESQGYTIYTSEFWNSNRDSEIRKYRKALSRKSPFFEAPAETNEVEYRRLLGLPSDGALLVSEIEAAFRIRAKDVHPDAGGSEEEFKRLNVAKDALSKNWKFDAGITLSAFCD
jgi:hypothetical protein